MALYKFDLAIEIEAVDIDDAQEVLFQIEDGRVSVTFTAPHADNPEDYPDE